MINVCLQSVFVSYFIWVFLSNVLFFITIKYSENSMKMIVMIRTIFDAVMFFTLPLLLLMTSGVCI